MAEYLKQRGDTWYVQVAVPKDLQARLNKKVIVQALGTDSLAIAKEVRWPAVTGIKDQFAKLRQPDIDIDTPADLIRAARRDIGGDVQAWNQAMDAFLLDRFPRGEDGVTPEIPEDWQPSVSRAYKLVRGEGGKSILEALEQHLEEIESRVRNQTRNARERRIEDLVDWSGDLDLRDLTRQRCGDYVSKEIIKEGRSAKTSRDILSDISAFWNWALDRGYATENPWRGQSRTIRDTKRGTRAKNSKKRRAWSKTELRTLLTTLRREHGTDDALWHMTLIALYTGMRANEIAHMELTDVHKDHFHISEAKTESSVRDVPIHPMIRTLVTKLKKNSKDGYLISGLKPGGEDDKRGHGVLKRFSHFKRTHVTDDRALVFHSLRNTMATALENAGAPENVSSQIMGHGKDSMTYGLYSDGVALPVLKRAVSKVDYGVAVSKLI